MTESSPPPFPPQPASIVRTRKRWGCLPIGCLVVVLVLGFFGISGGVVYWLFTQGGKAFLSDKPVAVRVADATDEQYQAVLTKLAPLGQAMNDGHAATLEITPDDLNVLIARSPQFETLRGRLFLNAGGNQLVADVSTPLAENDSSHYLNGRATLDASYTSNGFVIFLRRVEPLDPAQANNRFTGVLNYPATLAAISQQLSDGFNEGFRQQTANDPAATAFLRDLRTIVVQDGKIVITTNERPGGAPVEAPTPTPVAAGADQT